MNAVDVGIGMDDVVVAYIVVVVNDVVVSAAAMELVLHCVLNVQDDFGVVTTAAGVCQARL